MGKQKEVIKENRSCSICYLPTSDDNFIKDETIIDTIIKIENKNYSSFLKNISITKWIKILIRK